MKNIILAILLTVLTISASTQAQEETAPPNELTNEELEQDSLERLLKIPEVAKIKESCEKTEPETIGDCVWRNVQLNETLMATISEKVKLNNEGVDEEDVANYESLQLNPIIRKFEKKDPVVQKLEDFLVKKYEDAFYGKKGEDKKHAGHENFYQLYKTQLGKNLISKMSEFCLDSNFTEANPGTTQFIVTDHNIAQRKKNINMLSDTSAGSLALFEKDAKAEGQSIQKKWERCISNIQPICDKQKAVTIDKKTKKIKRDTTSFIVKNKKTQQRACEVKLLAQEVRQNLQITKKITERFKQLNAQSSTGFQYVTNNGSKIKKSFEGKGDNSMNALTSISSGEAVNESGLKKEADAQFEKFIAQCYALKLDSEGKILPDNQQLMGGLGKDAEKCKDYVGADRKMLQEQLAEFTLRAKVQGEKLKKDLTSDDQIEKYLKEEGYSDEKIKELMSLNDNTKIIKRMIEKRYKVEQDQALELIKSKIRKTTAKADKINFAESEDHDTLVKVGRRLANRAEQFKQLIHFNNITSAFLELEEETTKKKTRNITGLQRELAGSAYKKDPKDPNSGRRLDALQKRVEDSQVLNGAGDAGSDDDTGAELGIDKINEIFDYTRSE